MDEKGRKKELKRLVKVMKDFKKSKQLLDYLGWEYLLDVGWTEEFLDEDEEEPTGLYSKGDLHGLTVLEALEQEESIPKYVSSTEMVIRQAASIHDVYAYGAPQKIDWDDVPGHR